ncbi:hypothetical protein RYX36_007813, partial [Vicia faba]
ATVDINSLKELDKLWIVNLPSKTQCFGRKLIINRLSKDLQHPTKSEKTYADKCSIIEKKLLEESSKNKFLIKENEDLKASIVKLIDGLNATERSCVNLQKSMEKSQMDVFNAWDMAFDRAKDQVLCLYPELDISLVEIFKSIVDSKLVDMEVEEDGDEPPTAGEPRIEDASHVDET